MAEYVGLSANLTISPIAVAQAPVLLDITNLSRNSVINDITFENAALDASRAAFKRVTVEVYMDDGRGFVVQVPSSEIGKDITIKESMDGWADELDLSLIGTKFSPLLSSLIRGKRRVEVWITYGSPGSEYRTSAPAFTGYVLKGTFTDYPPSARMIFLDSAILYSDEKIDYSLEVNSRKSRLDILNELLAQGTPVPGGVIDLGPTPGIVNKSMSTGTDARKFDFIRDFLTPLGVFMWFENDVLNIQKYDPGSAIQRILTKSDLAVPVVMDIPATTDADVLKGVSVKFSTTELLTGERVEVKTEEWKKIYSRQTARFIQDAGGVIAASIFLPDPPVMRVVRRIITTNRFKGSTLMQSQIEEFQWFSPEVGRLAFETPDGTHASRWVGPNIGFMAYQFEDGKWHKDPIEDFQLVKKTILTKEADINDWIIKSTENQWFWHFTHQALYQVQHNPGARPPDTIEQDLHVGVIIPLQENGDALYQRVESIGLLDASGSFMLNGEAELAQFIHPDASTVIEWAVDANGQIQVETKTDTKWGTGQVSSANAEGAYHYGISTKLYTGQQFETFDADQTIVTTSFSQIDEETFQKTEITSTPADSVIHTTVEKGSRPFAEKIQPLSASQEMNVTLTDATRVALSGRVLDELHNEYCENEAELRVAVAQELRMKSAFRIVFPMPIEGKLHKAQWIAVDYPDVGFTPDKKMLVWGVQRNFQAFRQDVTCLYFPDEVRFI